MDYKTLIETLSEIVNNETICKTDLILTYSLTEEIHKKMNEELFYRMNNKNDILELSDEFEVEIDGILVKFIKKTI